MKLNANNKDVMAVWALHEEVLASFNALDMEKLLSLHTDNIILMEPGMPTITGKKEVIRLFEKFRKQSIALNLSYKIDELEVFGEMALLDHKPHIASVRAIADVKLFVILGSAFEFLCQENPNFISQLKNISERRKFQNLYR